MDFDTMRRPSASPELLEIGAIPSFQPDPDLMLWVDSVFLDEDGPLYTGDHDHLPKGEIACMWTNVEQIKKDRRVIGQAEKPGTGATWSTARAIQQLEGWFGYIPPFLLTFDALACASLDNATFCALVAHELYHCGQATDRFGMPRFNEATGEPVWRINPHDVEEFVGVVRQFGIEAAGPEALELVLAAAQPPISGVSAVGNACGTCLRAAA